ncbi:recombination regulator RecX [Burkholderia sp. TSV86]|uniref:recombination regulator RecX n=1 Tax=Burkholderia sp. TSV86 TaxID=1385594 RepID=UPI00075EBADD|nr:recombination regulator RecX [Burkholderia sp. TSV86]KVE39475.1 recombination regulator RecX [Burkholderia sp. TSV86]
MRKNREGAGPHSTAYGMQAASAGSRRAGRHMRTADSSAGRPTGRPAAGASDDDALVSFERPAAGESRDLHDSRDSFVSADSFQPDESFDAHDDARPRAAGGATARSMFSSAVSEGGSAGGDVYTRTNQSVSRSRRRASRSSAISSEGAGAECESAAQRPTRSLKARAIAYLSRREYSRAELARKLAPYVGDGDDPQSLLDTLETEGWLSDARFAESLLHRRAARVGAVRIIGELKRHAVGDALVEAVSAQLLDSELERAQAVWRKKFGVVPQTLAERAKQARFLASRGFSRTAIAKVLKGDIDEFGGD